VGPALGGMLAKPAETMPFLFGNSILFKKYPYLLPCLVASSFSIVGVFIGFYFLEETLTSRTITSAITTSKDEESKQVLLEQNAESTTTLFTQPLPESEPMPFWQVLTHEVKLNIGAYAMWAFLHVIFDEVLNLFVVTPLTSGGLSMSSTEMGFVLSSLGIVQILCQIFCYPVVERHLGLVKTFRLSAILMIIFTLLLPFVNDFTLSFLTDSQGLLTAHSRAIVYLLLFFILTGKTIACCFGYVSVMICVNDSCPDMRSLGVVHGCGQGKWFFI
jgi:hypothetical protein